MTPRGAEAPAPGWLEALIRRLAPAGGLSGSHDVRTRLGMLEGYVSMAVSLLLCAGKAVLGWVSGSLSLLADAANNGADIGTSLVVALSFRWSRKPRDKEHPYGHGRVESVAGLVLSIALIVVGLEVGHAGVQRLLNPQPLWVPWWLMAAVALTVALKAALAWFAAILARYTGSTVLKADAWNHFFDILSTALVLLALLGAGIGWPGLDGWAGLGVSGFIIFTGLRYAKKTVDTLVGEAPSLDEIRRIKQIGLEIAPVHSVHDVLIHDYGNLKLISFDIELDAKLTALECHEITARVEKAIAAAIQAKVIVHADPVDHSHPQYAAVTAAFDQAVRDDRRLVGYHDLRVTGMATKLNVSADLVAAEHIDAKEFGDIAGAAWRRLAGARPEICDLDIGVESEYASDPDYRRTFSAPGT